RSRLEVPMDPRPSQQALRYTAICCRRCGSDQHTAFAWHRFRNGARHIRAWCHRCKRFVRRLPHTPGNRAEADQAELNTLGLLMALEAAGVTICRRGEYLSA